MSTYKPDIPFTLPGNVVEHRKKVSLIEIGRENIQFNTTARLEFSISSSYTVENANKISKDVTDSIEESMRKSNIEKALIFLQNILEKTPTITEIG